MADEIKEPIQEPEVQDMVLEDEEIQGVSLEVVTKWKETYGTLFVIRWIDTTYVYRAFTYSEYKQLRRQIKEKYGNNIEEADEAFKELIQNTCVIWPTNYVARRDTGKPSPIPGGIPFLLSDYILAASGFSDQIIPDIIQK